MQICSFTLVEIYHGNLSYSLYLPLATLDRLCISYFFFLKDTNKPLEFDFYSDLSYSLAKLDVLSNNFPIFFQLDFTVECGAVCNAHLQHQGKISDAVSEHLS